jgi:hypothetical protein
MSLRIKDDEPSRAEWNRKARDATNGLIRRLAGCGTTAERPVNAVTGQMYYDTTLGKPVWRHASGAWKDAAGTAA